VFLPVVAEAAFAALAYLISFVTVVVGLPAMEAVAIDVTIQFALPILDVLVAAIPANGAGVSNAAEKHESAR
jgi:hypothetical protein